MKLQNKILLMLIIAFSFILFFNISNVKASNDIIPTRIENETLFNLIYETDEYLSGNYVFYIAHPTNSSSELTVMFLKYSDDLKVYVDNFSGSEYRVYYNKSVQRVNYSYYKNGTTLNKNWSGNASSDTFGYSSTAEFYSNFDIYNDNTYTTLFFQVPVVEEPTQETQGIIAPLLDQQKMEETTLQIRVIIPLIIVVVVSFLGLRKALKMLSQILHRS